MGRHAGRTGREPGIVRASPDAPDGASGRAHAPGGPGPGRRPAYPGQRRRARLLRRRGPGRSTRPAQNLRGGRPGRRAQGTAANAGTGRPVRDPAGPGRRLVPGRDAGGDHGLARRRGSRPGHRRGHHQPQGDGGQPGTAGHDRPADRSGQPRPFLLPGLGRNPAARPSRRPPRGRDARHRLLQAHQRHPRPRNRGRRPRGLRRPVPEPCARTGHRGPHRRRGIRHVSSRHRPQRRPGPGRTPARGVGGTGR